MKLIKLTCKNKPQFREVKFNPSGLSLIVGESSLDSDNQSGSNGVGKTLTLSILHHCLAADASRTRNSFFKTELADWVFVLEFSLNNQIYTIERSGDSTHLKLNGKDIKLKQLRDWFNNHGPFFNLSNIPTLSFRSLIKRFTRLTKKDCDSPTATEQEKPYTALLVTSYLLGIDTTLITNKANIKQDLDAINKQIKFLREYSQGKSSSRIEINSLTQKAQQLENDLKNFEVAENYRDIQVESEKNNSELNKLNKELALLKFQLQNINQSLIEDEDISAKDLMRFYEGLKLIFTEESLKHFNEVENFYNSLRHNRKIRLLDDKIRISNKIDQISSNIATLTQKKNKFLQLLNTKGALEDYANLVKTLEQKKTELEKLTKISDEVSHLKNKKIELQRLLLEQTQQALAYINENPLEELNIIFRSYAQTMYPDHSAGLDYTVNEKTNQIRYDVTVEIQGDGSDGIGDAKTLCFDLLTYLNGSNHSMKFLWHDNRLFAHISPEARANWFCLILDKLLNTDRQYIASINEENFNSVLDLVDTCTKKALQDSVILSLRGGKDQDKLLGKTFQVKLNSK